MGGKMVSKRLSIYGFISAAAVVSGVLVGCGGGGSNVSGSSGTVNTTGGVGTTTQTFTTGVGSSTTPQQVQVTVNGSTVNASLPAGTTIPAGSNVAVIPPKPIINGLTRGPKVIGEKAAPQSTIAFEVYDNGADTGVSVDSTGSLSGYLILIPGNHKLTATGPFTIVGGTGLVPSKLTMQAVTFGVPVLPSGIPAIPDYVNAKLPANNAKIAKGAFVTAYYDPSFAGYSGTLTIKYGATTLIKNIKFAVDTVATDPYVGDVFGTYNALSQHPAIPRAGVDSVEFDVQQ